MNTSLAIRFTRPTSGSVTHAVTSFEKQILAECKATRGGGVAAYTNIVFFAGD